MRPSAFRWGSGTPSSRRLPELAGVTGRPAEVRARLVDASGRLVGSRRHAVVLVGCSIAVQGVLL